MGITQDEISKLIHLGYAAGERLREQVSSDFRGNPDARLVFTEALVAGLYQTDCKVKDIELLLEGREKL